ncbi:MAG: glycoside hydrolase family 43 protein [Candidatus Hydrogenedentota bacterium]
MSRRGFLSALGLGAALWTYPTRLKAETPASNGDALLMTYFVGNGETGLHLAYSEDGNTFEALNNGEPLLPPEAGEARLMRDPSIRAGPDGRFHMVWTTSWEGVTIGYAHSEDLIHWSGQRAIPVFEGHPDIDPNDVHNCWAPEVYYHDEKQQFIVVWASTVEGRFPETLGAGHGDLNHRQYYFTTPDFEAISEAKLMYDPGFHVIDAAIFKPDEDRYAMVVKDETLEPEAKHLFLTFADSPTGPWGEPTEPITGDYWCEGPTPILIGDWWYIYFDKYRQGQWGAVRSMDLEEWEDVSDKIHMPDGARHGTAFYAPQSVLEALKELQPQ